MPKIPNTKPKIFLGEVQEPTMSLDNEPVDNILPELTYENPQPKGMTGQAIASISFLDLNEISDHVKMLVYGRNGSGKTYFAGTATDVCFLAVEEGTRTLKNIPNFSGKVLRIKTFEDFEQAYWLLQKNTHMFKTVAIDSLTRLVQIALRHEVIEAQKKTVIDEAVISLTQRDYGNMTQRIIYWLSAMFALPLNFIVLCQERTTTDDAEMVEYQGFPDMPRALRSHILGDMDIVGRMYLKTTDEGRGAASFNMLVGPNERYWTKDRTASLGLVIKNPDFTKIYEKYRG